MQIDAGIVMAQDEFDRIKISVNCILRYDDA